MRPSDPPVSSVLSASWSDPPAAVEALAAVAVGQLVVVAQVVPRGNATRRWALARTDTTGGKDGSAWSRYPWAIRPPQCRPVSSLAGLLPSSLDLPQCRPAT